MTSPSPTFQELGLNELITIKRLGYHHPTPVQVKCVPLALLGKDILARSRTGSGKTMAYAMPIIHKILHEKVNDTKAVRSVRCVVLVPTKELSEQVCDAFKALTRYCAKQISTCSLAADEPAHDQLHKVAALPDIVVTTPSRLAHHIKGRNISLASLGSLVVDEADLLLSFGYDEDLRTVAAVIPGSCQTFLMSATLTKEVDSLKNLILHNPVLVKIDDDDASAESNLKQFYLEYAKCSADDKFLILYAVLRLRTGGRRSLVFVNSVDHGWKVKLFLDNFGIRAAVLTSELPSSSRAHIISSYNRGVFDILIATDETLIDPRESLNNESAKMTFGESETQKKPKSHEKIKRRQEDGDQLMSGIETSAKQIVPKRRKDAEYGVARGIDFKGVDMVINFDAARDVKSHLHRIGRTARAGAKGQALSLFCERETPMRRDLGDYVNESNQVLLPYPMTVDSVSGFRYRIEDILRSISKNLVRDARLVELRTEILNSQKLKGHFEYHTRDFDALRHEKPVQSVKLQPHLRHIPSYLTPTGSFAIQQDDFHIKVASQKKSEEQLLLARKRKRAADPLRTFSAAKPVRQKVKTASAPKKWCKPHILTC